MKKKTPKIRNPIAYALSLRGKGKVMKHRSTPRGGAENQTLELLQQAAEEEYYEEEPDEQRRQGTSPDPARGRGEPEAGSEEEA